MCVFGVTSAVLFACSQRLSLAKPKNVVDEMQLIHDKYGVKQVTFYDDAFTVDRNRVIEICDELHARKLDMMWDCGTRVDMVDRELLTTMRSAGCFGRLAGRGIWF